MEVSALGLLLAGCIGATIAGSYLVLLVVLTCMQRLVGRVQPPSARDAGPVRVPVSVDPRVAHAAVPA